MVLLLEVLAITGLVALFLAWLDAQRHPPLWRSWEPPASETKGCALVPPWARPGASRLDEMSEADLEAWLRDEAALRDALGETHERRPS